MANRFSIDKPKEKKSIWSNPTTPLDVSQFKNEPIKSTAKPLDLNVKPRTTVSGDIKLPFDATKTGIFTNTILGLPKAAKDIFFPTRGYEEEEIKKANPSVTQKIMGVPKVAAEIFAGTTELGNTTLGELLSDIKPLQRFTQTKAGGKLADIGEGVSKGVEKLYEFSQPKNVEEASAMRLADIGTFFVGELKIGGTSAQLIAKSKNPTKIFNVLKSEIPDASDDGLKVLSNILTNVDKADDVQKVINRTNYALNQVKSEIKSTPAIKPKPGEADPLKPLVTKTQVKGMIKAMGDDVDFKVIEENGKKYMAFNDGKTDVMLRPTALGIADDSVNVGQVVNINSNNLKPTGTRFSVSEAPVKQIMPDVKETQAVTDHLAIEAKSMKEMPGNWEMQKDQNIKVGDSVDVYGRGLDSGKISDIQTNDTGQVIYSVVMDGETKPIKMLRDGFNATEVLVGKGIQEITPSTDTWNKAQEVKPVVKETIPEKAQPLFSGSQKLATQEASIPAEDFLPKLDQPSVIEKVPSKSYKDTIPKISDDVYKQNRSVGSSKRTWLKATKENIAGAKKGTAKLLAPISTQLKNLNIKLKQEMRKFEYNLSQETTKDNNAITPFMKKMKKLSNSDQMDLDLALKNRDASKVDEIVKENGLEKEFAEVRKTLDDIHKRANDIGIEVNYFKNYFPREVDNPTEFLNYLEETYGWKEIDQAIKNKEEELGRYLNVNEKASVADDYIAPREKVLIQTGAMKPRTIDFIGSDLNRFYKDSRVALNNYIQTMNDAIESWKFFNLGTKANKFTTVDSSIGSYVFKKVSDGTITPAQATELENILKARFKDVGTSGAVSLYKNLSYIDTMGSPISAITQVGDLGFATYRTGPLATTKEAVKSLFGQSEIKRGDIGIEKIAQEFNDTGATARALDFVFKATGLQKIDAIGKETLINSIINKYRKLASGKNILDEQGNIVGVSSGDFMRRLENVFGDETAQVINDLKSGEVTENVKYLAFNELLDIQPLKLSEMPEQYLKGGNGRIFYMLKTYTIKLFDVYRNEVFQEMKRNKVRGIKNLIYLTSSLVLANATADEIKDFVLGRETSLKDRTVDNLLRLVGFTKWTIYKARMEGLASATIKTILPPTKFLDSLYKDITKEKEVRDMEVIQSIPFIGKLYYWWFGKGSTKSSKKKETTGNRF